MPRAVEATGVVRSKRLRRAHSNDSNQSERSSPVSFAHPAPKRRKLPEKVSAAAAQKQKKQRLPASSASRLTPTGKSQTGYYGVRPCGENTFRARIFDKTTGSHKHLGIFSDPKEAARAYDKARRLQPSERHVRVNFPRTKQERLAAGLDPQSARTSGGASAAKQKPNKAVSAASRAKHGSLPSGSERPAVISVAVGARHEREAAALSMRGMGVAKSNSGRWRAQVGLNHVTHCLGTYDTKLLASEVCHVARMRYARELEDANLDLDSLKRQAERAIKMEGLDKSKGKEGKKKAKGKSKSNGRPGTKEKVVLGKSGQGVLASRTKDKIKAKVKLKVAALAKAKAKRANSSVGKSVGRSSGRMYSSGDLVCQPVAKGVQSSTEHKRMWWCAQCGRVFARHYRLSEHMKSQHGPAQTKKYRREGREGVAKAEAALEEVGGAAQRLQCLDCGVTFASGLLLAAHMEAKHMSVGKSSAAAAGAAAGAGRNGGARASTSASASSSAGPSAIASSRMSKPVLKAAPPLPPGKRLRLEPFVRTSTTASAVAVRLAQPLYARGRGEILELLRGAGLHNLSGRPKVDVIAAVVSLLAHLPSVGSQAENVSVLKLLGASQISDADYDNSLTPSKNQQKMCVQLKTSVQQVLEELERQSL